MPRSFRVPTSRDLWHRFALVSKVLMAFTMAALKAEAEIRIEDCINVNTSFPGFVKLASQAGITLSTEEL